MARHWSPLVPLFLILVPFAPAKDKKETLPAQVLEAKTVLVVIDPNAGISSSNPNENRTAQENVEKALMNQGRFSPVLDATNADLVISVRRGHGKAVTNTIGSVPNDRPVIMEPMTPAYASAPSTGRLLRSRQIRPRRAPIPDRDWTNGGHVHRVSRKGRVSSRQRSGLALRRKRRSQFALCSRRCSISESD